MLTRDISVTDYDIFVTFPDIAPPSPDTPKQSSQTDPKPDERIYLLANRRAGEVFHPQKK